MANRLEEIAERWQNATPGPWRVVVNGNTVKSHAIPGVCSGISPKTGNANAIAYAPQDIAFLLTEVNRLRGTLADIADGSPYSVTHQSDHYYRDIARAAIDWRDKQEEGKA